MKLLTALPAFNVEHILEAVLAQLPRIDTLVVDDGSSDATSVIAESLGFKVIRHAHNKGVTAAWISATEFAEESGYSAILFMDSDGQHPPILQQKFAAALHQNDVVIGDRFFDPKIVPAIKLASNLLASMLVGSSTGVFMRDVSCGFRGHKIGMLDPREQSGSGYSGVYDLTIKAMTDQLSISRVKVPPIYDTDNILGTRPYEIIGLCEAVLRNGIEQKTAITLLTSVQTRRDFNLRLKGIEFTGKYLKDFQIYQIHCNQNELFNAYDHFN